MVKTLKVKNIAVVEEAAVCFSPELNVITGETGAGKSVLMGAIALVLGGRADASIVRDGAKEGEVEIEVEGYRIRRTITSEGRSRAWVNDESVSIAELRALGTKLVDVHGPTANQRLTEENFQRETLDDFGGHKKELKAYRTSYDQYKTILDQIAALENVGGVSVEDEIDLLKFQVNEIESADLSEEDETLAERHAAAAHQEEIVENANAVTEALGGDRSAAELLIAMQSKFHAMAKHFPPAEEWAKEADDITLRLQELSRSVADAVSKLDAGEESLDELDKRLTIVNKLKRKFGGSVKEILEKLDEKRNRLEALENRDEKLAALKKELAAAEGEVRALGGELTKARRKASEKIGKAVTKELHDLGFVEAKFFIAIEAGTIESHGLDRVVYMFEPNPGESARPLADIASSGEIARVMLAMKSILSRQDSVGTLIFDEIDANIGGEVGRIVGEKLRALGEHKQVIAITHLPQSAVYGRKHLVVSKCVEQGRTFTHIREVTGEKRVAEIARMLGGEDLTSVVRKHATELLAGAK